MSEENLAEEELRIIFLRQLKVYLYKRFFNLYIEQFEPAMRQCAAELTGAFSKLSEQIVITLAPIRALIEEVIEIEEEKQNFDRRR